jgi:hypothetical protein
LESLPSSVLKKLLRRKKEGERAPETHYRTWNRYSCFTFSPTHLWCLFSSCRSEPTGSPPLFPPPPPFVPLESTRTESEVIGLLRPFYKSRFDALAQSQVATPPPTTNGVTAVGDPSASQMIQLSQGSCYDRLSPLQHSFNRMCSSLHSLNRKRYSSFQAMCQTRLKRNKDRAARADCWWEVDERCQEEETEEREDPPSSTTGSGGVPGVVSGLVGGGMNGVINMNFSNGTSAQ